MSTKYTAPKSQPGRIAGLSRQAGAATDETKQIVINAILKKADEYGLSNKDKANLIAFVNIESGFNPDAVSGSGVGGVMQVESRTARDAKRRLRGPNGNHLGSYNSFDMNSNIEYGIAIYLDKKRIANSEEADKIYIKYNSVKEQYAKHLDHLKTDSALFEEELNSSGRISLDTVYSTKNSPNPHYSPHKHPSTPKPTAPQKPVRHHPATPAKHLSVDPHQIQGIAPPTWSEPDALGIRSPMVCYDMHILEGLF